MGRHLLRGRLQPAWHCSKFHVVLPLLSHSRTLKLHLGLPSLTRPARARGRARAAPFPQPFNALFEIVSCFGNVGLTLGVTVDEPDLAGMAFSAQVNGVSKIMFMLVMIVGRTRGMPTRMDAAFSTSRSLSKDEILKKMEEEPETCGFIPRQTPGALPHLPGFQDRGGHGGDGGMDGGDWTREVRLSQGSR
mmetsp:Transcript_57597/g.158580  ORF Transcript_57597/g.158580 Transcript_57597/m.158580 type:complete len:191 (+) Transcript_57597:1845-2417(+)